ncbi:MAG: amidase [Actinobacteria bacterium]|nr:amidase [Actinomycetota bacterium]
MVDELVGRTAIELAGLVRSREVDPVDVLTAHLDAITEHDDRVRAFQCFRRGPAFEEARELERRIRLEDEDLSRLPLAGVPIAIKDNVDVEGLPTRNGSHATSSRPAERDAEMVRRLKDAGAIIVGKTRVPEFCLWAFTESLAYGTTHNPWDLRYTPGGSSGGSAAAVSANMVPSALGSDGMGSIRIPSAACGLFGIKPGTGVVTKRGVPHDWYGLSEWGPVATTVADAALMLDVLAGRSDLRVPEPPERPLRVAVSRKPSVPVPVDEELASAVDRTARELRALGHHVRQADPPAPTGAALAITKRRIEGLLDEFEDGERGTVEPRTRVEIRLARVSRRVSPVDPQEADRFRALVDAWFADHDLLLLPTIAKQPALVGENHGRGFIATSAQQAAYTVFCSRWNLAGYPAASIPAGLSEDGLPIGVQLVAPRGGERVVLSVAAQLEARRPWPRHAPSAV